MSHKPKSPRIQTILGFFFFCFFSVILQNYTFLDIKVWEQVWEFLVVTP